MFRRGKSLKTERELVVAQGRGVTTGYRESFGGDEYALKLILVLTAQLCEYTKRH